MKECSQLCRICLTEEAEISLFDGEEAYNVRSKLVQCLQEEVLDYFGYPRYICERCHMNLNNVYEFINKYKTTQNELQSNLLCIKLEENNLCFAATNLLDTNDEPIMDSLFSSEESVIKEVPIMAEVRADASETNKGAKKRKRTKKVFMDEGNIKALKTSQNCTDIQSQVGKIFQKMHEIPLTADGELSLLEDWCRFSPGNKNNEQITKTEPDDEKKGLIEVNNTNKNILKETLCEICGAQFRKQESYRSHKETIHFPKKIQCEKCPKVFANIKNLRRHKNGVHSILKRLICALCGIGFNNKHILDRHHKVVHLNQKKKYSCQYCNKVYACAKSVLIHERSTHTGMRPAVCSVCNKAFFHEDYLQEHMRLHTGETPFKCPVCGRGYAQKCNMWRHMKQHRYTEVDPQLLHTMKSSLLKHLGY